MFVPDTAKQSSCQKPFAQTVSTSKLQPEAVLSSEMMPRDRLQAKHPTQKMKSNAPAKKVATASDVLQAFNTWAFKREQPETPETLLLKIQAAMDAGRAVEFVLYWGKGPRSEPASFEAACLDYLASMAARIRAVYAPGAVFRLICTDTHATLNGHPRAAYDAYFEGVTEMAAARGFTTCRLGDLVETHDPDQRFHVEGDLSQDPMFAHLTRCAAKWYAGEGCVEEGAEQYYRMNLREARVVECAFPDSVFVTFNGSTFRGLFPANLPIFYMYSMKRGCAVKPWFLPAPAADGAVTAE